MVQKMTLSREEQLAMLTNMRKETKERYRSLRKGIAEQHREHVDVGDACDNAESFIQDEVSATVAHQYHEVIAQIDRAELEIRQGTYGKCQECENEISPARLRALPSATLCLDCKEKQEVGSFKPHPLHGLINSSSTQ